jgi:isoquinoline 1-oxidoreductase alpha subunit
MPFTVRINGADRSADVDADTPLLWVLRDTFGLTGTKYACGTAICGACTVLVDGKAVASCALPISEVGNRSVVTIEGLAAGADHPVQRAWLAEEVVQCGYCQPGLILAAVALLNEMPRPSERDIQSRIGNLCRCGTYSRVVRAIQRAANG